jgi:hypothetical protein
MNEIVVGVDLSQSARAAVTWAAGQARATGQTLQAVTRSVDRPLVLLGGFLGFPPLARLLGGSWPSTLGWAVAFCAVPIVIIVDASYKALRRSRSRELVLASVRITSGGPR